MAQCRAPFPTGQVKLVSFSLTTHLSTGEILLPKTGITLAEYSYLIQYFLTVATGSDKHSFLYYAFLKSINYFFIY